MPFEKGKVINMLITDVKIYPVVGEEIENGYIHIENSKISAIGSMETLTITDEDTHSYHGATAYPGFIDGHTHIGLFGEGIGVEGEDGNEDTDPITPHLKGVDAIHPFDKSFPEAVMGGVTTAVTGPGSANPIAGQFTAIKTVGNIVDNMIVKESCAMKFALGENPKSAYHSKGNAPATRMATAAMIRDQLRKAKHYMEDKAEALSDEDMDEPDYDSKCEALITLLKKEIPPHIHAHRADDIATALRLSKEFDLSPVLIHCTEGHLIADELGKIKADVVCGPIISTRSKPELSNLTPSTAGILAKAGARVSICTDHPVIPIQYLNVSAGVAVREGMDYDKAIEAITINPAIHAGIDNRVGSIEVGKDADIVIFDCDPLTLFAKPKAVLIDGEFVHKA